MSLFDDRAIRPMLLTGKPEPFDDPNFLFELKLDGIRAIAYIDNGFLDIRDKRNVRVDSKYPELSGIHAQVKGRAVLDGEIIIMKQGVPNFSRLLRRCAMTNRSSIMFASQQLPVSFIAYDLLYLGNEPMIKHPIEDRKEELSKLVMESERLAISRFIHTQGLALYQQAVARKLEGIVCKRLGSTYQMGKKSRDWIKVKDIKDEDYVVCGYIEKPDGNASIVLGSYADGILVYQSHISLKISRTDLQRVRAHARAGEEYYLHFPSHPKDTIWLKPTLAVRFMERTESGSLRQPVFKGFRDDKSPDECTI